MKIHPSSEVYSRSIGVGTNVWQYTVILSGAVVGKNCNIGSHCFIEDECKIGDNVTIKNHVALFNGCQIGNDVFIGPNVTFTNDKYPRSRRLNRDPHSKHLTVTILNGASIGGGAVILPGITVGVGAMIGAGAVVTKDVPSNSLVVGNPAILVT